MSQTVLTPSSLSPAMGQAIERLPPPSLLPSTMLKPQLLHRLQHLPLQQQVEGAVEGVDTHHLQLTPSLQLFPNFQLKLLPPLFLPATNYQLQAIPVSPNSPQLKSMLSLTYSNPSTPTKLLSPKSRPLSVIPLLPRLQVTSHKPQAIPSLVLSNSV